MPCSLNKDDVANIMIEVIGAIEGERVTAKTAFWEDLRVDKEARRGYYVPLRRRFTKEGCPFARFKPADLNDTKTVGDVIKAVAQDLGLQKDENEQ
jgi:hypothetical protein